MENVQSPELAKRLKSVNIYLVGMMGAGKSTVGKLLADQLGYRFFDTDSLIEQATGQTVSAIFAESGEAVFRELETKVLAELSAYGRTVVSTGGGIVVEKRNWSYLHHGLIVWLNIPVGQLYQRLKEKSDRPLLADPNPLEKLQQILEQRQVRYAQADICLNLSGKEPPNQVAATILSSIEQRLNEDAIAPNPDLN